MDVSIWKTLFGAWPPDMPRRGILVTGFGEQVPFSGFMTSEAFVCLDRQNPDSLGARTLVIPYESIAALKIVDVVKPSALRGLGFSGPAKS